ncbi:MAG: hypothetical protein JNL57_06895 [Bacteroidetes bacterium]|nr:hypothetical protein [Bacteroidota bacterium]
MRQLFLAGLLLTILSASGQGAMDAIRYSMIGAGGTARSYGLGGGFSSIGADASAIMVNPAGLAAFRRNEYNFGFQFLNTANKSDYLDENLRESRLNFNLPTMNLILAQIKFDDKGKPRKKGLTNINYQLGINRMVNYNNRIAFDATNRQSSISDFLANIASNENADPFNLPLGSLPRLAYDAGAISNFTSTTQYTSGYKDSVRNSRQTGEIAQKGGIYEYQVGLGVNFSHKILMGLGLYYTSLSFSEEMSLLETDQRPAGTMAQADMSTIDYQAKFMDKGNAFGARFGIIGRPTEQLRIGFSVHTPRTYTINSEYGYSIGVTLDPLTGFSNPPAQYNDPLSTYKYKVTTPARYNAGVGLVVAKTGLINAEFDFYDYTQTRLSATDAVSYATENNNLRRNYRNVMNIRVGGELNIPNPEDPEQAYRLRAGLAIYQNPFSTKTAGTDEILKKANTQMSAGFGFRDKDYYLDFSLSYGTNSYYFTPYLTGSSYFPASTITNKQSRVAFSFTAGFNFD